MVPQQITTYLKLPEAQNGGETTNKTSYSFLSHRMVEQQLTEHCNPSDFVMHRQVQHTKTVRSAFRVHLCILYGSENRQTDRHYFPVLYNINRLVSVTETGCVYCAVRTKYLNVMQVTFLR